FVDSRLSGVANVKFAPLVWRSETAGAFGDAFDDEPAGVTELVGEIAQAQPLLTDAQAIELNKLGLIEFDRDARPDSVDIVRLPVRRHGHGHDRVRRHIE